MTHFESGKQVTSRLGFLIPGTFISLQNSYSFGQLKVALIFDPAKIFDSLKPTFPTTTTLILRNVQNGYQPKIKRIKSFNKKQYQLYLHKFK